MGSRSSRLAAQALQGLPTGFSISLSLSDSSRLRFKPRLLLASVTQQYQISTFIPVPHEIVRNSKRVVRINFSRQSRIIINPVRVPSSSSPAGSPARPRPVCDVASLTHSLTHLTSLSHSLARLARLPRSLASLAHSLTHSLYSRATTGVAEAASPKLDLRSPNICSIVSSVPSAAAMA